MIRSGINSENWTLLSSLWPSQNQNIVLRVWIVAKYSWKYDMHYVSKFHQSLAIFAVRISNIAWDNEYHFK
jgi:hypothetical protein